MSIPIDDDYRINLETLETMPAGLYKAIGLALSGLLTDGENHKQWYLEQILIALGQPLDYVREHVQEWKRGISP